VLASLLLLAVQASGPDLRLGINVNEVREWTSDVSFANVARQAGPWRMLADPTQLATLDAAGNPLEPAKSIVFTGDYPYPPGLYVLDAEPGITLGGAGVIASAGGGRFWRLAGRGAVSIVATTTPTREIDLWEGRNYGQTFSPYYLSLLQRFEPDTIRTLNWSRIRFVGYGGRQGWIPDWSQRTLPGETRQNVDRGVALELHRRLWEEVGSNGWINIPHLADEEYVRGMARVFDGFAGTLYVEFSNEGWNSSFPVNAWVQANRGALSPGAYFGQQARQAFEWWADEVDTTRVRFVVMGFLRDVGFARDQVEQVGGLADAVGCAAYFRGDPRPASPQELVETARANLQAVTRPGVAEHAALALQHGIEFLGYEGGPNLLGGMSVPADTLPEIGLGCTELFQMADEEGMTMLCVYAAFRLPSPLGSYGWRHSLLDSTPKWDAALDWTALLPRKP